MKNINSEEILPANSIDTIIQTGELDGRGFTNENGIVIIGDKEIDDNLTIESNLHYGSNTHYLKSIVFRKCTFNGSIHIEDYSKSGFWKFYDCVFNTSVTFNGFARSLFLHDCKFKDKFKVVSSEAKVIQIENSIFEGELLLSGHYKESITLTNINVGGGQNKHRIFSISEATVNEIEVTNAEFFAVNISDASNLENTTVFNKLHAESFIFNNAKIGNNIRIKDSVINELSFDNIIEGDPAHRYLELKEECKIYNATFALHMLENTVISNCKFQNLRLWGRNEEDSIFNIQESAIDKIIFDQVYNKGLITIRKSDVPFTATFVTIAFNSSTLGKSDFILCDFSNGRLEFENSKISEVFLSQTDFPKVVYNNGKIDPAQARLAFGQLHTTFLKQGDTVRALEYQSREIEAHYNQLKGKGGINLTRVNLWLNKISNDFGRNWGRGILFTLGLGVLFFYLLVISTKEYELGFGFPVFCDGRLVAAFVKYMNPIRFLETDTLFKGSLNQPFATLSGVSYILDMVGRILITYGIYQTIQAFRRFGRK